MDSFFVLSQKTKEQYTKRDILVPNGYDAIGRERLVLPTVENGCPVLTPQTISDQLVQT